MRNVRDGRAWTLALLLGCGGSEGEPAAAAENDGCEVVSSSKLDLATESELGFSANDVLAYAGGTRSETLNWGALRVGGYGPEKGQSTLTLGLDPRGAKLVRYTGAGNQELGTDCQTQLEVDVDLTLKSSGGALDEVKRSTLVARRPEVASLQTRFDLDELKGTLTLSAPSAESAGPGWTAKGVTFRSQFTPFAASGWMNARFEKREGDAVSTTDGIGTVAYFGVGGCQYGVGVPLDATGRASSASTRARIVQHTSASFGGSPTTLTAQLADTACWHLGDPLDPFGTSVSLYGQLWVKTADGRIDGQWPIDVIGRPDANGQLTGPVEVRFQGGLTTAAMPDLQFGIKGVDSSGYDSTLTTITLAVGEAGWSGAIVIEGLRAGERRELARFDVR